MGRHKTVDREQVLDVAEEIVAKRGAAALTIDGVAKAAGISKGGVQSTFGTKEALVAAMLARWTKSYEEAYARRVGPDPSPVERVRAHADVTHQDTDAAQERVAGLLSILLQSPDHLEPTRRWYANRFQGLGEGTDFRLRLAFLATEGAFLLRYLNLLPLDRDLWDRVFADISRLLADESA
ncbi:TetR/AcrR family transcriptional regulator [Rhizobium leguminosarum]